GLGREQVAGIGVAGDQAQRLALAAPPDEHRWAGTADRGWDADGLGELVVPALVGPVVVAPHLEADLQGLLEPLEALGDGRKRDAEARVLAVVTGGADAELGPPARQHVERRDGLGEQPWVAVRDPGDQKTEPDARGLRGEEAERRVA